jgi:hypothetical protein
MGRRRKNTNAQGFLGLVIGIGVLWLIVQLLTSPRFLAGVGFVILLGVGAAIAYGTMRRNQREINQRALIQKAEEIIEQHLNALVRMRAQLVRVDAYGTLQVEKWGKEKDRFISQQIGPTLGTDEQEALERDWTPIQNLIEARVETATQQNPVFGNFSDDMTPTEFEQFCAEELRKAGWSARVTLRSRDQGIDVVAENEGVRVVLQCKLYSGPVGNKCVQEIAAGKAHEQAHYGVVVSNNRYTYAAEQLAQTNGILLLHYCDLPNLSDRIRQKRLMA